MMSYYFFYLLIILELYNSGLYYSFQIAQILMLDNPKSKIDYMVHYHELKASKENERSLLYFFNRSDPVIMHTEESKFFRLTNLLLFLLANYFRTLQ